ncbi:hypothetical protein [Halalkalicoccus tibetensis]|uniref:Polysaccharide deacetylase n=1 Tax=Halalkalicoccus tibetensis TaxID=175632 RepID=A0ABD5V6Q7_9EURY
MNIRDFTFDHYEKLLDAALDNGYTFYSVDEHIRRSDHDNPYIAIRHDVDRKVSTARSMAKTEAERDIPTTYYFRTSTFSPKIVAEVADLGHEVGYHYEDFVKSRGNIKESHKRFARNLARFREHAEVTTICPHGSPLSPHHNLDMWTNENSIEDYDLTGEAYLSMETSHNDSAKPSYLSDTGRNWNTSLPGIGQLSTTDDLITALEADCCNRLYLLVHPGRWSRSTTEQIQRVAWDLAAEVGKTAAKTVHTIL